MRCRSQFPRLARTVVLALFAGISVSALQPAVAAPDSGAKQATSTTRSLTSGYSAEGSGTNPVTAQVTGARAKRATSQCTNQRSCPSPSSPEVTKQAENTGAGRAKHSHPSAASQPDSTVESSPSRLTVGTTASGKASAVSLPLSHARTACALKGGTSASRLTGSYWLSSPHLLALSTESRPGIPAMAELARGPGPEDVEH